jgi:hypothetical protein
MTEPLTSEVWLIKSRTNPFPVKGEMAFADGSVSVTITDGKSCVEAMRTYLEEQTSQPGLKERLAQGEQVKVLEFRPSDAEVSFPKTAGGYIAKVETAGKTWYVALAYPAGGAITNVMSMSKGRKLAKTWKSALGV